MTKPAGLPWANLSFRAVLGLFLIFLILLLGGVLLSVILFLGWHDFAKAILDPESLFSIKLTAAAVTVATIISIIVGVPAAYTLSRHRLPLAPVIDTIIDLPLVLPSLIAGIALLVFFQTGTGHWIQDHILDFPERSAGIVLAIFFATVSLGVRSMKAAFDSVDPRYEQVARTLGCSEVQAFLRVSLPLARNGLIASAVLTWTKSLGEFGAILMFVGATRGRTDVIPIAVFLNMTTGKIAAGMALTVVLLIIAAASLIIFKRLGGKAQLA